MVSRVYHLTSNITIAANPPLAPGTRIEYVFVQDATGGRTITWDASFNDAPQPDQAPNAVSLIEFFSVNGTNWRYDGPLFTVPWSTLIQSKSALAAAAAAGTYVLKTDGSAPTLSSAAMGGASAFFPLDSAQYSIATKLVQVRLVASVLNNATAPAANFTFHLYSFTVAGLVPTLTAAVGEQTAVVTAPGADAQPPVYGAAFTMPAAAGQGFALGVVTSAIIAAGANPLLNCRLEARVI